MTEKLDVTPKTTERNRIVRTNKSEAKVTNNKKCARAIALLKQRSILTDPKHRAAS